MYEELAQRGSILYFAIVDLAKIEQMYQFSLEQFKNLFIKIMRETPACETTEERII